MKTKVTLQYTFEVIPNENGYITIVCLNLPGCVSQGKTMKKAVSNIREAMQGWLEVNKETQYGNS